MTRCSLLLGCLLWSVAVACQQSSGGSPAETAEQFLQAVREVEPEKVFRLLAPEDKAALRRLAEVANAQAGGGRELQPWDLLAVGQRPPEIELGKIEVSETPQGDQATVALISADRKVREELQLVRAEDRWYVRLPDKLLQKSAEQPASAPAAR